jgi:putative oxidoreductase
VRRLFSTFAGGLPGVGLLLMRLVAGFALAARGVVRLLAGATFESAILQIFAVAIGVSLIAGLWTPVAGSLVGVLGLWYAVSRSGDPSASIFLATIGAALALLGPGAWSVDARLFGWRRIDVRDRAV